MRPSDETIEMLTPALMGNAENAIADFMAWQGQHDVPQSLVNMLFAAYVAGMVNTMDPKSQWNSRFNAVTANAK